MYICKERDEDKYYCSEEGVACNQCCQDCNKVKTCNHHCDYAHDFNCMAKVKQPD